MYGCCFLNNNSLPSNFSREQNTRDTLQHNQISTMERLVKNLIMFQISVQNKSASEPL